MQCEGTAVTEPIRVSEEFGDGSGELVLNPSGTLVAVLDLDRKADRRQALSVYSTADNRCVAGPQKLSDCRGLRFIDDRTLLILNERKCLRWKVPGAPKKLTSFGGDFLYGLAARPGCGVFAVAVEHRGGLGDWQVVLADLKTGKRRRTVGLPLSLRYGLTPASVILSPGGELLAAEISPMSGDERGLVVCDVATGRRLQTWLSEQRVSAMTFAPEGALFAFAEQGQTDQALVVYELSGADPVRVLRLPEPLNGGAALRFAADGSWLDLLDYRGCRVRLNPTTGRVLEQQEPPVELAEFRPIALSADGRVAAGVTADFTVAVWALGSDDPRQPPRKRKR
jgi:hypothetical protein